MRCAKVKRRISDYVDNELDSRRISSLEQHLSLCPDCHKLFEDLQEISSGAKELDEMSPGEHVWQRIRSRIGEDQKEQMVSIPKKPPWFAVQDFRYAVGAVALLAVIIGVMTIGPQLWNKQEILTADNQQQYTLDKLEEAERHYQLAVKALGEAAAAQKKELDPRIAEVFYAHLEVINESIEACRLAVLEDPEDLDSRNYLLAAYKKKATLLDEMINSNESSRKSVIDNTL